MPDKPAHSTLQPKTGATKPGAPGHDEWLIDEAVEETFPASDPIAPSQPANSRARKDK
ncbi:MAG TPA: hypothetical protein VHA15_10170 [Burkholderiales bacterium]|jgi:hypothetical protein|nr:hypothetical protein [Burkholderiales bacterium]